MPDQDAPRKPPRRFWLVAPYILLGLAIIGWSAGWMVLKGQMEQHMDRAAADLRKAGFEVAWKERKLEGYPFRFYVTLTEPRVREPSGWALDMPILKAEASAFNTKHWMIVASDGAVVTRPVSGGLRVSGKALRASFVATGAPLPRIAVEGAQLTFTPEPGARPFALSKAERLEFHLVPGGKEEAALLFRIDGGKPAAGGLTARLAGEKPVSVLWDSLLSQRDDLTGPDWPQAVRHWTDAGGTMTLRKGGITLGDTCLGLSSGSLTVGVDGRLRGSLEAQLTRGSGAVLAMGETGLIEPNGAQIAAAVLQARELTSDGKSAQATISFEAGRTTLGPVAIGPAPKVY
jgi:hypothetical protein